MLTVWNCSLLVRILPRWRTNVYSHQQLHHWLKASPKVRCSVHFCSPYICSSSASVFTSSISTPTDCLTSIKTLMQTNSRSRNYNKSDTIINTCFWQWPLLGLQNHLLPLQKTCLHPLLPFSPAKTLIYAFFPSRLYCCNSILLWYISQNPQSTPIYPELCCPSPHPLLWPHQLCAS